MPGNVDNAVSTTVLPNALSRQYVRNREYPLRSAEYADGRSQRFLLGATSRKSWRISRRISPTELTELRDFFEARGGAKETFIFYDVQEDAADNGTYRYDETGVLVADHKYEVRFDIPWAQSVGLARGDVDLVLVEVT